MLIEVTAEDIDAGKRRDCHGCPVATALDRATGERWAVGVDERGRAVARRERFDGWFALPRAASEFVRRFDAGGMPGPFTFEFDAEAARVAASV